jgi:tRNA modification GTPase
MDERSDTIAAISTPSGLGGVGIIRISGSKAVNIIEQIASTPFNLSSLISLKTRKLIHGFILDQNREKIDEVLLAFMPTEKSYTGEQTVEIHCHGGRAVLTLILNRTLESGSRLASPGEFTRRAFENGRINLIQAEAINEIIRARTGSAVKAAWRQFDGGLNTLCKKLRSNLEKIIINVQAEIDFELRINEIENINQTVAHAQKIIDDLLLQHGINKPDNSVIWITLVGPANSGKSSIFNKIVRAERSIVSDLPGTTVDYISEILEIEGKEIRITDTAGFKEPNSQIQTNSIERTIKQQQAADLVLYVVDQSQDISNYISEIYSVLNFGGMVLLNKCDLSSHYTVKKFIEDKNNNCFFTSALYDQGIEEVLNKISEKIVFDHGENNISINIRQKVLLLKAKEELNNCLKLIKHDYLDMFCFHLKEAAKSLSEIIGEITTEETLELIFSRFCIGK